MSSRPTRTTRHAASAAFPAAAALLSFAQTAGAQALANQSLEEARCAGPAREGADRHVALRHRASYTMAVEPQSKTKAPGQRWQSVPGSDTMASTLNFGLNHVAGRSRSGSRSMRRTSSSAHGSRTPSDIRPIGQTSCATPLTSLSLSRLPPAGFLGRRRMRRKASI